MRLRGAAAAPLLERPFEPVANWSASDVLASASMGIGMAVSCPMSSAALSVFAWSN